MVLLDKDAFLLRLTQFFTENKDSAKGSVLITCKRVNENAWRLKRGNPAKKAKTVEVGGPLCLVRAVYGKKKISTEIRQADVGKFQEEYGIILKASISNLKKKSKKRPSKSSRSTHE